MWELPTKPLHFHIKKLSATSYIFYKINQIDISILRVIRFYFYGFESLLFKLTLKAYILRTCGKSRIIKGDYYNYYNQQSINALFVM